MGGALSTVPALVVGDNQAELNAAEWYGSAIDKCISSKSNGDEIAGCVRLEIVKRFKAGWLPEGHGIGFSCGKRESI